MDREALQAIVHVVAKDSATKQSMIAKKSFFFRFMKRDKTVIAWVDSLLRNLGNLMDQETLFSLEGVLFCLNRLCGSGFEVAIPPTLREL